MKRSKFINLEGMRKSRTLFALKPIAIGVTAAVLSACGDNRQDVKIVTSVEDCVSNTTFELEQCEVAYRNALAEAEKTGPKYSSLRSCESEFGDNQCIATSNNSFFMPLMAGFMINELLFDRDRRYYSGYYNPVYRYYRPYSPHHNLMMMADGTSLGKYGKRSYKVSKSATKKKPAITRTVSRGGFGSVASAKSSWGKSSSKSWGG